MIDDRKDMTCAEFHNLMPELIGSGANASEHPHVQHCELCRALLKDLETIAVAARQLFPIEDPPDTLWDKLEASIKGGDDHH